MSPERKALVDSLERHALYYWAKQKAYTEGSVVGAAKRGEESDLARTRLLVASYALGEYDATIHPIDPSTPA